MSAPKPVKTLTLILSALRRPRAAALSAFAALAWAVAPTAHTATGQDAAEYCLALTVYFETAAGEFEDQQAVAHVVLNRVAHASFPAEVCAVVRQGGEEPPCQFNWWCDGRSDRPQRGAHWDSARRVADEALAGRSTDPTGGALYFHRADLGRLSWTRPLTRVARIGAHVYYR